MLGPDLQCAIRCPSTPGSRPITHIDLPWLPPDLFTANASAAMKDRMPYVTDGPDGPHWTCKNGQSFGLV